MLVHLIEAELMSHALKMVNSFRLGDIAFRRGNLCTASKYSRVCSDTWRIQHCCSYRLKSESDIIDEHKSCLLPYRVAFQWLIAVARSARLSLLDRCRRQLSPLLWPQVGVTNRSITAIVDTQWGAKSGLFAASLFAGPVI